jgi:hypothetical protein
MPALYQTSTHLNKIIDVLSIIFTLTTTQVWDMLAPKFVFQIITSMQKTEGQEELPIRTKERVCRFRRETGANGRPLSFVRFAGALSSLG